MRIGFQSVCLWILILVPWTAGAAADAFEYRLGAGVFESVQENRNYWDPDTRQFDRDELFTVTSGYADLSASTGGTVSGYLSGAVDWIHDFEPEPEDDIDVQLVNAYLRVEGKTGSADIGKQRFLFGRGLILDDDEPGVSLLWSPGESHYFDIKAARAVDTSPLVSLTAGYRPGFLEKIEVFGIYMQDNDNGFADMLNRQIGDNNFPDLLNLQTPLNPFSGDGEIGWLGVAADLFVSDFFFSGIGMWETGRMTVVHPRGETDFDLSAYLFDLEGSYNLTPAFSAGLFLFAASGDLHPGSGEIHAFLSPLPYNPRADIFFSGGLDGSDIMKGFSLAGNHCPGNETDLAAISELAV